MVIKKVLWIWVVVIGVLALAGLTFYLFDEPIEEKFTCENRPDPVDVEF